MRNDKQSEEVLTERAVKKTIQTLHEKGLKNKYDNANDVIKDCLLIDEVNQSRRLDLGELKKIMSFKDFIDNYGL